MRLLREYPSFSESNDGKVNVPQSILVSFQNLRSVGRREPGLTSRWWGRSDERPQWGDLQKFVSAEGRMPSTTSVPSREPRICR